MRERYEDWTTHECVEGGADDSYGSGSGPDDGPVFLNPTGATDEQIADAITLASDVLFGRTGKLLTGVSPPRSLRPCRRFRNGWPAWRGFARVQLPDTSALWWDDTWGTCTCGWSNDTCGCATRSRIGLGVYPIHSVVVRIDGELLPADAYTVVDHQWLVRLDGDPWPLCQDPYADPSEVGTFEALTSIGDDLPAGAQVAACLYAREIALGMVDGDDCALPSHIISLVRQGTSAQFDSLSNLISEHRTGVDLVDQWVDAFNEGRRPTRPTTFIIPDYQPGQQAARLGPWQP